jgi:hypothetical protein
MMVTNIMETTEPEELWLSLEKLIHAYWNKMEWGKILGK